MILGSPSEAHSSTVVVPKPGSVDGIPALALAYEPRSSFKLFMYPVDSPVARMYAAKSRLIWSAAWPQYPSETASYLQQSYYAWDAGDGVNCLTPRNMLCTLIND